MRPQWARSTSVTDLIPNRIVTMGHDSTLNSDPSTYLLPVELRLNKVSKINGAIKIQQLGRVIIQRKIHWIVTPGRYSMGGGGQNFILHRRRRPQSDTSYATVTLHKPTVTGQWLAILWKIGRRRYRFCLLFGRPTTFLVEAPKLKVSLTDPSIFRGFVIGEASGDDWPTVGRRLFEEIYI